MKLGDRLVPGMEGSDWGAPEHLSVLQHGGGNTGLSPYTTLTEKEGNKQMCR